MWSRASASNGPSAAPARRVSSTPPAAGSAPRSDRPGRGTFSQRAWPAASTTPQMPVSCRPRPRLDRQPDSIDPADAPRAVRARREALDDASEVGRAEGHLAVRSGLAMDRRGAAYFACSTNHLTDTGNGVIPDVEAAGRSGWPRSDRCGPDRPGERDLRHRAQPADRGHRLWLRRHAGLAGPAARYRGPFPGIRDLRPQGRDGMTERGDVTYVAASDVFSCPGGKEVKQNLRTLKHPREAKPDQDGRPRYRAGKAACHAGEPDCRVPRRVPFVTDREASALSCVTLPGFPDLGSHATFRASLSPGAMRFPQGDQPLCGGNGSLGVRAAPGSATGLV